MVPADADPATRRLMQGGAAVVAAAAAGGVVAAGGGGGRMANEGRWTDNGQPLTLAEGRTVLPMLDQAEQAIAARLLPSEAFDDGGGGGDGEAAAAAARPGAGAGAGGPREVKGGGGVSQCSRPWFVSFWSHVV